MQCLLKHFICYWHHTGVLSENEPVKMSHFTYIYTCALLVRKNSNKNIVITSWFDVIARKSNGGLYFLLLLLLLFFCNQDVFLSQQFWWKIAVASEEQVINCCVFINKESVFDSGNETQPSAIFEQNVLPHPQGCVFFKLQVTKPCTVCCAKVR